MDFVLVHGTTQSPAGWDRLAKVLSARGHRGHCVDLIGSEPGSVAADYGTAVADQLDVASPIVVAHSGSGLLLPALARSLGASQQVFLAAYIPDGHQSLTEDIEAHADEIFNPSWLDADPYTDPRAAREFLFHDCNEATSLWALSTIRLFYPEAVYREVVAPATGIPAMAIVPDQDRTLRPDWMEVATRERLGIEPVVVPGGHCLHVSRPETIADHLVGLADP